MKKGYLILTIALTLLLVGVTIYFGVRVAREKAEAERVEALIEAQEVGALSSEAVRVKQELIAPLGGQAGTLLEAESMKIGYLPPPDEMILVLISGTSVEEAEEEAISWLLSRGFRRPDLCNLPVVFSVTNPNAQASKEYKLESNYLPEYCLE